jgi:hypothetical protein
VPITTPANFGGTSWAEVVKRTGNNKKEQQAPPKHKSNSENPINIKLNRMEQAINQIKSNPKKSKVERNGN